MKNLLLALAIVGVLAGCVTQSTYSGTNKPVVRTQTDRAEAATKRLELGLAYLKAGDAVQAKFNLEKAREFAPRMPQVHSSLAYFYQQVGEIEQARKAYQYAISLDAQNASILNNYGVFLCAQQEFTEADNYFLAAIAVPTYTKVADAYENAGVCALEADEQAKAQRYFERALSYNALRPRSLLLLAELAYEQRDYATSAMYLQRFHINRQPTATSSRLAYLLARVNADVRELVKYSEILKTQYPDVYKVLQAQPLPAVRSTPQPKIKRIHKPTARTHGEDAKAPQTPPKTNMRSLVNAHKAHIPTTEQATEAEVMHEGVGNGAKMGIMPRGFEQIFYEGNWQALQMQLRVETQLWLNHRHLYAQQSHPLR